MAGPFSLRGATLGRAGGPPRTPAHPTALARDPGRAPRAGRGLAAPTPDDGRCSPARGRLHQGPPGSRPAKARRPPPLSLPEGAEAGGGGLAGPSRRRILRPPRYRLPASAVRGRCPERAAAAAAFLWPRRRLARRSRPPLPLRGRTSATPATFYGRPPGAPKRPRLPRALASGSPWTPRPRGPSWLGGGRPGASRTSLPRGGAAPAAVGSRFRRGTPQRSKEAPPPRTRRGARSVGEMLWAAVSTPLPATERARLGPQGAPPRGRGRVRPPAPPEGNDGPPFRVVVRALQ